MRCRSPDDRYRAAVLCEVSCSGTVSNVQVHDRMITATLVEGPPKTERNVLMSDHEEWKAVESMTAADVMTVSPRTCSSFSSVLEAVMIFRDSDCGAVPILDEGKPVAILTDRDVALALAEVPDLVNQPVSAIMAPGIVTVAPEDSLHDVCEVLSRQGVRRVLVV